MVENAKKIYYSNLLKSSRDLWKTAKLIMKQEDAAVPDKIMDNGKLERSPEKICNIFCKFFIEKVRKIKKSIPNTVQNPLEILKKLVPETKEELRFKEITNKECYNIIDETRTSNTCGFDSISPRIMKMIPHVMSIFLTHGINQILRTKTFPEILKITRVLPISKKQKNKLLPSSYRPISNLHTFKKVVEKWMKMQKITLFWKDIMENSKDIPP